MDEVFGGRGYINDKEDSNTVEDGTVDRYDGLSDEEDSRRGSRGQINGRMNDGYGFDSPNLGFTRHGMIKDILGNRLEPKLEEEWQHDYEILGLQKNIEDLKLK